MRRAIILPALATLFAALLVTTPAASAPDNDAFENATPISSVPFSATADLANATRQSGEPIDCYAVRRSVWYSFTPGADTDLQLLFSSATHALFSAAIYTMPAGQTFPNLQRVRCSAGYSSLDIRHTVAAGTPAWIQVGAGLDGSPSVSMTVKYLTRITGIVTDEGSNLLAGICVTTHTTGGGTESSPQATTAADGTYTLIRVTPGDHKVKFTACKDAKYATQWWNGKATSSEAGIVTTSLETGVTSGIDAAMSRQSRILGTLLDRRGKPAMSCVYAYQDGIPAGAGWSSSSGAYFFAIPPGTYVIRAGSCGFYGTTYYLNKASEAEADPVPVPEQTDVTLADIELEPGGSISGRLTDPSGAPVFDCIEAFDSSGTLVRTVYSNSQGYYDLFGFTTGSYRIRFAGCSFAKGVTTWFGGDSLETADDVQVVYGQDTPNIDAVVLPGASISGRLTDSEGFPLPGECVGLYTEAGDPVRTYIADGNGNYAATRIPDGSYKLRFGCTRDLEPEWYDNKSDAVSATSVPTSLVAPTTGIDAVLDFKTAPANDTFAAATSVTSLPFKDLQDVTMATMEAGEPNRCGGSTMRGSIWYRYTAPEVRPVRASTEGTIDFDTIIAVYIQGPNGLVQLDCANDYANFLGERLDFLALPGIEMFIQVSGSAVWPALYTGLVTFKLS